jgi:hypothetical protein
MKYTTVYDYYSTLSSQRYYIIFLCVSVILFVVCFCTEKKLCVDKSDNINFWISIERFILLILITVFLILTISFSLILCRPSSNEVKKNNIRIVSGKVSDFYPASYLGCTSDQYAIFKADPERFYVDDTYFKYDTLHLWYPGYRKTYYRGGYIRSNGQIVRITYYYDMKKMENIIIKLEVADS